MTRQDPSWPDGTPMREGDRVIVKTMREAGTIEGFTGMELHEEHEHLTAVRVKFRDGPSPMTGCSIGRGVTCCSCVLERA